MEYFDFEECKTHKVKQSIAYLIVKRLFDFVIALLALILISPIFFIVWTLNLISKDNRGPLLYRQVRIGLNGREFKIYKFRSMIVKAEEKLKQDKKLYAEYVANNYKLTPDRDPRITKLGSFLRKTSVDELPQFINILKGEMSLVGPRPVIEDELVEYNREKLLSVKPGAMGLWQTCGRSDVGYPERADIEMKYVDKACFFYDLKIIVGNFISIVKGCGAY